MIREIGSIFPLNDTTISGAEKTGKPFPDDRLYFSLCREALRAIADSLSDSNKNVLLPAYTCQTVITPFEEAGWKCNYFSIHKNLRIDLQSLASQVSQYRPAVIVVHPFFGMELDEREESMLQQITAQGVRIILDLTQCLFSTKRYPFVTFTVGSFRKWFPIPDGGFLERNTYTAIISQPQNENVEFTEKELAAMYLRDQYFHIGEQRTKDISIRLSKAADILADNNIQPHKMSAIAYNLLLQEDFERNRQQRYDNYTFLYNNISDDDKLEKVCKDLSMVTTAPLYFTIYVENRSALQRKLAQHAIYAPVIWPVEDERVLINNEVRYIYDHLLAIPIDQRYHVEDMRRVVGVINDLKL